MHELNRITVARVQAALEKTGAKLVGGITWSSHLKKPVNAVPARTTDGIARQMV